MWRYDNDHDAMGWGVMGLSTLLFLLVIAILAYWVVRTIRQSSSLPANRQAELSAEEILAARLARGDIEIDDYKRRKRALRDQP